MSSYDERDSLDGAIDATVLEMMQVDPRPGLRHRVAGSIGARTRRSLSFRFGLPAFAAAMVLLVSVLILRPSAPPSPVHAPQVAGPQTAGPRTAGPRTAETTPAVPANPLTWPRTAGPQTAERSTETAGSLPQVSATVPSARPRRRSAPTPESIFGGRSDRITAASIPGASAEPPGNDVLEMAPEFRGLESGLGITPLWLAPIQVTPITIQPLSFNSLPRR